MPDVSFADRSGVLQQQLQDVSKPVDSHARDQIESPARHINPASAAHSVSRSNISEVCARCGWIHGNQLKKYIDCIVEYHGRGQHMHTTFNSTNVH